VVLISGQVPLVITSSLEKNSFNIVPQPRGSPLK
jgi:hypothetical protein